MLDSVFLLAQTVGGKGVAQQAAMNGVLVTFGAEDAIDTVHRDHSDVLLALSVALTVAPDVFPAGRVGVAEFLRADTNNSAISFRES